MPLRPVRPFWLRPSSSRACAPACSASCAYIMPLSHSGVVAMSSILSKAVDNSIPLDDIAHAGI
eukprot:12121833-Alexandrium_andersonii.AAC.1